MILLALALCLSTPDGLPPRATPPTPAAETKPTQTIVLPTPTAEPAALNGKGEKVRVTADEPADSTPRVVSPNCRCRVCSCEVCVCGMAEEPKAEPDPRRWYPLGGPYAGYQGYGTAQPDGTILVSWHCKAGTNDVRRGLPNLQPVAAPYAFTPPPTSCASGQCPTAAYTYQRGYFGFRGR
jgi:hypothetical protein